MTNSFQSSSLGFPTSKTNYLQTEVDMTEPVNKQIDETTKQMNAHFDRLIKISIDQSKGRSQQWQQLAKFTKQGMEFANYAMKKAEADADVKNYYDPDRLETRLKESKDTDKLEEELDESHKEAYTESAALEETDPDIAKLLKSFKDKVITQKETFAIGEQYSEQWFEKSRSQHLTRLPEGEWRSFDDPRNTAVDRMLISADLDSAYISLFEGAGLSKRLLKKHLIEPMHEKHKQRLITEQQAQNAAQKVIEKEKRHSEFRTNLLKNPGKAIEDYLQTYNSYHAEVSGDLSAGYAIAKGELLGMILDDIKNERFTMKELGEIDEDLSEYPLTPNDGGKSRTIEEYLPKFANPIKNAIRQARTDKIKKDKDDEQIAIRQKEAEYKNYFESLGRPATKDQLFEKQQEFRSETGKDSEYLSNYITQQDIDDKEIDRLLNKRWMNSEEIFIEDLAGITDPEMYSKWITRVSSGGLDATLTQRKNDIITAHVSTRLWDKTLERTKTNPQYEIIESQAQDYFNNIFRSEKDLGQTTLKAYELARDATVKAINEGAFDTRDSATRDETRAENILAAKKAIAKDSNIIYSSDPWAGEEKELESALKYITTGKGAIPQYYRQFPGINLTPYELMKTRLESTKTTKPSDIDSIPERELKPENQDLLLNKPTPARTNRVLLDDTENIDPLLELIGIDSVEELLERLRLNAERNNQLNGTEISLVNIDPELQEEHTQVVGEQSPFMRLDTMLPGVATAYVEEIYNV